MTRQLPLARASIDRAAHRRTDEAWLAGAWADPSSRVVLVDRSGRAAAEGDALTLVSPGDAPPGLRLFLGEGEDSAWFAVVSAEPVADPVSLRDIGVRLDTRDAGLLTAAAALAQWHDRNPHCPRCGAPTEPRAGGYVRRCVADGSEHHPRSDPAVIMLVTDGDGRCVLGRGAAWPQGRRSVLAGFVEAGESLEMAVAREVREEVGLDVADIRYVASQPWPFPASLMLAFTASVTGGRLEADREEILEAEWWTREELRAAVAQERIVLPTEVSIARRLLDDWLGSAAG